MRVAAVALGLLTATSVARAEAPCVEDPALALAAARLLEGSATLTPAGIMDAAREAGSDAPTVRARRFSPDDAKGAAAWLAAMVEPLPTPLHCGQASSAKAVIWVVAERAGRLEKNPVHDRQFRVVLAPGVTAPRLVVEGADGAIVDVPVAERGWTEIPEDVAPPFEVQLMADDGTGPRPVARREVGGRLVRAAPVLESSDGPPTEDRLMEWVLAVRSGEGVGALRSNRVLARVASRHAAEVCEVGRARHALGEGDPVERLRAAGLTARHVGEAVARVQPGGTVEAALRGSPSHTAALLDGRFTDVGVGLARDTAGVTCAAVLLAAWPRTAPIGAQAKP